MDSPIDLIISPRERDLGGFSVRRALPDGKRRAVGPFVFFDHFGPVAFDPGKGIDVRPHPHIGLATVTYLFEGEIVHRDNLGFTQTIRPGAVNWMIAGRGIVHSERTGEEERAKASPLHGIQSWLGLPQSEEERDPGFFHHAAETLPEVEVEGGMLRVIAGTLEGQTSPVKVLSPTVYGDLSLKPGGGIALPASLGERAVHVAAGEISVGKTRVSAGHMLILRDGTDSRIEATSEARVLILGGEPLDGARHVWWNFVSSSRERIEQAKKDWREGGFDPVPGDNERIPLPEEQE